MERSVRLLLATVLTVVVSPAFTGEAFGSDSSKPTCIPAEQCCRICDTGKACGKSCISRSFNCHKGRGCACNVEEVCAE